VERGPKRVGAGAGAIPWASLLALTAAHFAVDCCTGIWPIFKTLAQLDLARAGMIASAGSMVGNGLQVVLGPLADRGHRKRLLLGGVLLGGAVTFLPLASTYGPMFVLVLLTYVGSAAVHPAGTGSAATLSTSRTGVLVGIFLSGGYAGYSLSQIVFSSLYLRRPELTLLMALVPMAAAAAIALWVPSPRPAPRESGPRLSRALARGPLVPLFLVQVFSTAVHLGVIFLLPDLLLSRQAPSFMVHGGGHFALIAGGCLCLLPAGHAADRFGARRVLILANVVMGAALGALLMRQTATAVDLAIVAVLGGGTSTNNVVSVSEGNRRLPGRASGVSALLMGLPWCFAAAAPMIVGLLADPSRGGTPARALAWLGLAIPASLLAGSCVGPVRPTVAGA